MHQNRLVFVAPDYDTIIRLKDHIRTFLAWKSIVNDVEQARIVLDVLQVKQAKKSMENASNTTNRTITECYQWLLCPIQYPGKHGGVGKIEWESIRLNTGATSMINEIEKRMTDEEMLLKAWSPIHLDHMLRQWFWKQGVKDLNTYELWQKMCDYLYLPRLLDSSILQATISNGVASGDYFGYADGKDGDEYLGFKFKEPVSCVIDKSSLIIEREAAREYQAKKEAPVPQPGGEGGGDVPPGGSDGGTDGEGVVPPPGDSPVPQAKPKKRFYGTVDLDSHTGRMAYDEIQKEVINLLITRPGVSVHLKLDIEADSMEGFDENIQRAVRENCGTLNFSQADFDEE
jgi:hypothetical protein